MDMVKNRTKSLNESQQNMKFGDVSKTFGSPKDSEL